MKYQVCEPLTPEEYADLKASIAANGIRVPVELDEDGNVLDGHHRIRAWQELRAEGVNVPEYDKLVRYGMTEDEKIAYASDLNASRRQMTLSEREKQRRRVVTLRAEGKTLQEIAAEVGVSKSTVERELKTDFPSNGKSEITNARGQRRPTTYRPRAPKPQSLFVPGASALDSAAARQQVKSENEEKREAKESERHEQRQAAAAAAANAEIPELVTILTGDFAELGAQVEDNSVDLIFTDPPYDDASAPMYGDLAKLAQRVLKPGGSLITYVGHNALPVVLGLMTPHLRFWWPLAVHHNGGHRRLLGKWVFVHWKPLLWFVKDGRRDNEFVSDYVESAPPDKLLHDWQQDTSEAAYYIEHLTSPGELVLDPFCGSGTTLLAALSLGRRSVGIEIDAERAQVAKGRILDYSPGA